MLGKEEGKKSVSFFLLLLFVCLVVCLCSFGKERECVPEVPLCYEVELLS